jgi:hypothetical protein
MAKKNTCISGGLTSGGTTVPATGTAGYEPGTIFCKTDAALGQAPIWRNIGSISSCLFVPEGNLPGYGFKFAGILDCTNGSTTSNVLTDMADYRDLAFAGYYASDDSDQVQAAVTAGKSYLTLTNSADPLVAHDYQYAVLRNKCVPDWDIFAAGNHTTAGGNAAEAITVTGAAAGDIAVCCYGESNDTDVLRQSVVTANTLTCTCSADPSTAHEINYIILRPRGSFKPSHYVAYAGTHTTVADTSSPYTNDITVSGALTTDIPIVTWHTSDDTDTIIKAEITTAGTITVKLSANPSTTHKLNYMVLRAY